MLEGVPPVLERYLSAYPAVFDGVDPTLARRAVLVLGSTAGGSLWPRREVTDLLDRLAGRITFEEYRARR